MAKHDVIKFGFNFRLQTKTQTPTSNCTHKIINLQIQNKTFIHKYDHIILIILYIQTRLTMFFFYYFRVFSTNIPMCFHGTFLI